MLKRAICALTIMLSLAQTANAQQKTDNYRVALLGIPVGSLQITHAWAGNSYDAKSEFTTTGIAAVVRDVGFMMRSRGTATNVAYDPSFYRERMNTGQRKSQGKVEFAASDSRWDPNSAMLFVLGDRPVSQGCAFNQSLFDGKRSHQLVIQQGVVRNGKLVCAGRLERTGGYNKRQLAQLKGYNFAITYNVAGDTLVFDNAAVETLYGQATVTAR